MLDNRYITLQKTMHRIERVSMILEWIDTYSDSL